jgi:DNA-binding transcriptional MerR regulator
MKPAEAAALLGISASTIRSWTTGEFKPYFSPTAQGGSGRFRNLTELDVQILAYINLLKQESTPADEIHATLHRLQADDWSDLPPIVEVGARTDRVPVVAESALTNERRAFLREIAILEHLIEKLEAQLGSERADKEKLIRELVEAQTELKLWQSGRLKPE